MIVERISNIRPGRVEVIFGEGVHHSAKIIRSDLMADGGYEPPENLRAQLLLKIREAGRDIAYLKHGKDWRDYCGGNVWNEPPSDFENQLGVQAAKMRPDLFGEAA